MTRKLLPLLFAASLSILPLAQAQTFKDGPHLAYPLGGDVQDDNLAAGWQVEYEFSDFYSVELSVTRQKDSVTAPDLSVPGLPDLGSYDLTLWAFDLTAKIGTLVGKRTYLYGGAGAGYNAFTEDNESVRRVTAASSIPGPSGGSIENIELDLNDAFSFELAAGVEFLIRESWELFLEYRVIWLTTDASTTIIERVPAPDVTTSVRSSNADGTFDYNHSLVRLGVNYRF